MYKGLMMAAWLLGLGLLVPPAAADIDPPRVAGPVAPTLVPICVKLPRTQCGLLDRQGGWAVEPSYSKLYVRNDGWVFEQNRKFGYLDASGKVLIEPVLESLGRFSSGLASAGSDAVGNNEGYVDRAGQWVIAPAYFMTGDFSEGIAAVSTWMGGPNDRHAECYYILPDGKPAFEGRWDECNAFRFGMAMVGGHGIRTDPDFDRQSVALIDRKGRYLIPWGPRYKFTILARDRVLEYARDNHQALLDGHGRELLRVPKEGSLNDAGEGRLFYSMQTGNKGLLDATTAKPLITPANGWGVGWDFSDGVAWVTTHDGEQEWLSSLIDRHGQVVLEAASYDGFKSFFDGAAPVSRTGEKWRLMDRQGRPLTEALYARMAPAWSWGPQSPRLGDVWRAEVADKDGAVDWVDSKGARLASVSKLPCGIEVVRNAHGDIIWPREPRAYCLLAKPPPGYHGWDAPAGSDIDDSYLMAARVADSRESLAGRSGLNLGLGSLDPSAASDAQKVLMAPWRVGPATIDLGLEASLDLPPGYRYLEPKYVQVVLHQLGADPPQGDDAGNISTALIADDDLLVLLQFALVRHGHVATDRPQLDPASLKKRMQGGSTAFPGMAAQEPSARARDRDRAHDIEWLRKPRWNARSRRLDWAFNDSSARVVNSVRFGRLSAAALHTLFRDWQGDDRAVLAQHAIDQIMPHVNFKAGFAYDDAEPDDQPAPLGLEGFITGLPPAAQQVDALPSIGLPDDQSAEPHAVSLGGVLLGFAAAAILTLLFVWLILRSAKKP